MARRPLPTQHDRGPARSQHFLRDPDLADAIVRDLARWPGTVIDIGAGRGVITHALAGRGFRVIAVEKDVRLFRALRARFIGRTNVECHHGDILRFPLPRAPYAVVSNVPFAISAALVRRLLAAPTPPHDALLILQREAAEKFAGVPQETLFSLLAKPYVTLDVVRAFRRDDFAPPPSVESVLLRVRRREAPLVRATSRAAYARFVSMGFRRGGPDVRRTLRPLLTREQFRVMSCAVGVRARQRPSDLTFAQWMGMFRFYELVCLRRRAAGYRPMCWSNAAPAVQDALSPMRTASKRVGAGYPVISPPAQRPRESFTANAMTYGLSAEGLASGLITDVSATEAAEDVAFTLVRKPGKLAAQAARMPKPG
jgi:23S rRNA (adenine-N6)-dimethyltransferase